MKLSIRTILFYNMMGFALNVYDTVLYTWIPYFYTPPEESGKTMLLSITVLGLILAGGRILDAISDPVIGYASDKLRSRWGRRKPFIFLGNPILFLSFILLWTPPDSSNSISNAIYLGLILFVYFWAYTAVLIPWFAVLPEMSPENGQRVKIASIGVIIGAAGALVSGGLSGPLFTKFSPFLMALLLAIPALIGGYLTLKGIRENSNISESDSADSFERNFFLAFKKIFFDRQVLAFSGMIFFVQMTYQLLLMNVPYLTKLVLNLDEAYASVILGEFIIIVAISSPLWIYLSRHYTKRRIMRFVIIAMMFGFALNFFIGDYKFGHPLVDALLILPISAIPFSGLFTLSLGLIADLSDYGSLKNGRNEEALYYGIYGIVRKFGWALSSIILSLSYEFFGFSRSNPLGIKMIWIIALLSCAIGFIFFLWYKVEDHRELTEERFQLRNGD